MRLRLSSTISILLIVISSYSQTSLHNSPISTAQGGIYSTLSDVWSTMLNPAGIGYSKKFQTGLAYTRAYNLKELSTQSITTIAPSKIGNFGAYYQSFGFSLYKEHNLGIGYSRIFANNFSAGFQLNYANYHSSQSGNGGQIYSSVGIQFYPIEQLKVGASVINGEQSTLTIKDEPIKIPSIYNLGITWLASDNFLMTYEFEQEVDYGGISKFGLEYSYKEFLWLRGGINGKPIRYSFGIGLKISRFIIDYAASYHETLGMSSNIGLTLNWSKDDKK